MALFTSTTWPPMLRILRNTFARKCELVQSGVRTSRSINGQNTATWEPSSTRFAAVVFGILGCSWSRTNARVRSRSASLLEQRFNLGLVRRPGNDAAVRSSDLPLSIDQNRHRHRGDLKFFRSRIVADHDRVRDRLFLQVRTYRCPPVGIHRDADGIESCVFIFRVEIPEPRNFDLAPAAPCRPKIHQNHFAFSLRKPHGFTVLVCQREIWSRHSIAVCNQLRFGWRVGRNALPERNRAVDAALCQYARRRCRSQRESDDQRRG